MIWHGNSRSIKFENPSLSHYRSSLLSFRHLSEKCEVVRVKFDNSSFLNTLKNSTIKLFIYHLLNDTKYHSLPLLFLHIFDRSMRSDNKFLRKGEEKRLLGLRSN